MLSLPWLNAVVTAQSARAAEARALLDRVKSNARGDLDVPRTAPSVFIQSLAGHDGDGQNRSARITDDAAIQLVLRDLRHLSTIRNPARACDGSWWPSTAVITLSVKGASRTYAARFDDCGLVIAGTGVAGTITKQLLADVRRLVPNSGL